MNKGYSMLRLLAIAALGEIHESKQILRQLLTNDDRQVRLHWSQPVGTTWLSNPEII